MDDKTSSAASEVMEITPDPTKNSKRNFFQRLFSKCATEIPVDNDCWSYKGGKISVDLSKVQELAGAGGAIRLEGDNLPARVLLIKGDDGKFHAFRNECTHGKRRLDPVSGAGTVQCCSMGKSSFDYSGKRLAGSAKDDITVYPVEEQDGKVIITVE